jgi:hypothetical protein
MRRVISSSDCAVANFGALTAYPSPVHNDADTDSFGSSFVLWYALLLPLLLPALLPVILSVLVFVPALVLVLVLVLVNGSYAALFKKLSPQGQFVGHELCHVVAIQPSSCPVCGDQQILSAVVEYRHGFAFYDPAPGLAEVLSPTTNKRQAAVRQRVRVSTFSLLAQTSALGWQIEGKRAPAFPVPSWSGRRTSVVHVHGWSPSGSSKAVAPQHGMTGLEATWNWAPSGRWWAFVSGKGQSKRTAGRGIPPPSEQQGRFPQLGVCAGGPNFAQKQQIRNKIITGGTG